RTNYEPFATLTLREGRADAEEARVARNEYDDTPFADLASQPLAHRRDVALDHQPLGAMLREEGEVPLAAAEEIGALHNLELALRQAVAPIVTDADDVDGRPGGVRARQRRFRHATHRRPARTPAPARRRRSQTG